MIPSITPRAYNPLTMIAPQTPKKLSSKKKIDFSSIAPKIGVVDPLANAKVGTNNKTMENFTFSGVEKQNPLQIKKMIDKANVGIQQNKKIADFNTTYNMSKEDILDLGRSTKEQLLAQGENIEGLDDIDLAQFALDTAPEEERSQFVKAQDKSVGGKIKEFVKGPLASGVLGAMQGAADVGNAIGKGISYLDPTISDEERQKTFGQEGQDQMAGKLFGEERAGSTGFGVGREVGKIGATTALTRPIGGGGAKLGLLGKAALGAGAGAVQTQSANLISEGKPASLKETLLGAGIGGALGGVGGLLTKAKTSAYNSAFSQAGQAQKKQLAKYGQTAGEAVMEQNLPTSIKGGLEVIKSKLSNTWKSIEGTANKAGNIEGVAVKAGLKTDLIKKLGYDKLNQSSQSTKELIGKIGEVVDDMIPDGSITPKEILQQIKQINSTLGNTLVSKGFQDLKGNSKIQKVVTNGLKNVLDKVIEKGGGGSKEISKLYEQYGKQKTVELMLEDESIRKILGRQLVGGGVGAGIGFGAGYKDFEEGNILQGIAKVGAFSLGGSQIAKLANNPTFLMKLGKASGKIGDVVQGSRKILPALSAKTEK